MTELHVVSGTCQFLVERFFKEIRATLPKHTFHRQVGTDERSSAEMYLDVVEGLRSQGLFATQKIGVLDVGVVAANATKKQRQTFLQKVEAFSDDTNNPNVLIIRTTRQGSWIHKALKARKVAVKTHHFKAPSEWEVPKLCVEMAATKGITISDAFASGIVLNTGLGLYDVQNEVEKLVLYIKADGSGRSTVTIADIKAVLYQHAPVSPMEILGVWGLGEREKALRLFESAYKAMPRPESLIFSLITMMQNRVDNLLIAKALRVGGASDTKIAKALKVPVFIYKSKTERQVAARTLVALEEALIYLSKLEFLAKSEGPSKPLLEIALLDY